MFLFWKYYPANCTEKKTISTKGFKDLIFPSHYNTDVVMLCSDEYKEQLVLQQTENFYTAEITVISTFASYANKFGGDDSRGC